MVGDVVDDQSWGNVDNPFAGAVGFTTGCYGRDGSGRQPGNNPGSGFWWVEVNQIEALMFIRRRP